MMTTVLVYAYCVGVFSSRKIQRRLLEDVAFRVLAAGNQPDFRTIADFRKTHLRALAGLFEQVLHLALAAGALTLGRVALDGSKIKANASKHKAMSYQRMGETTRRLRQEVQHLLTQAEATDTQEDAHYGAGRRGDELPAELQRRESRVAKIRAAKQVLEARARQEAAAAGEPPKAGRPDPKAQYNFTDPDSRIMHGPDGFVQAYNVQVAVESTCQFIVGQTVTQATNEKQQLVPLIRTTEAQAGRQPQRVLADAGYCSEENLAAVAALGIDAYVATRKPRHNEPPPRAPRGRIPRHATLVDRMARKLRTVRGEERYALRKALVEPVLGQPTNRREIS